MGVAWYIALERDVPGVSSSSVDGKAFARAQEDLDRLAEEVGVVAPSNLLSQSDADAAAMAEEMGIEVDSLPTEAWFTADVGLVTIRGLVARVRPSPEMAAAVVDLEAMERVLAAAAVAGVRFHFAVDV